jgi:hypothetical protein
MTDTLFDTHTFVQNYLDDLTWWGIGCAPSAAIVGIDGFEIELLDNIDDEAGEMVGRQAIAQPHTRIQGGFIVERFELSVHARYSDTNIRQERLRLSDRLLVLRHDRM